MSSQTTDNNKRLDYLDVAKGIVTTQHPYRKLLVNKA